MPEKKSLHSQWLDYKQLGGTLNETDWLRAGKPKAPAGEPIYQAPPSWGERFKGQYWGMPTGGKPRIPERVSEAPKTTPTAIQKPTGEYVTPEGLSYTPPVAPGALVAPTGTYTDVVLYENEWWAVTKDLATGKVISYDTHLASAKDTSAQEASQLKDFLAQAQREYEFKTQKEQWGKEFAATQQAQQWQQQWQQKQATSQARQQQLQWQLQQKAELTGEKDWIQYYMLHRGIEQQGAEESARKQFEKAQTKADEAWIAYSTAIQGETLNPRITPGTYQFLQPGLDIARTQELAAGKTYEETARRPIGTPPAPDWLPQYVPGQVTGQPITKAPVRTPSGQMWAATSPTAQAGLAGYAEWAHPVSRTYADILAHMIQMQPEPVYGATTRRWQPARQ